MKKKYEDNEIVKLNVGGRIFQTTYQTLTWLKDTYFTGLFDQSFHQNLDSDKNFFIDRDPELFQHVLHFLRTKELSIDSLNIALTLISEAEFYAILPMVLRLRSYLSLTKKKCGNIYFSGFMSMKDKVYYSSDVFKSDNVSLESLPDSVPSALNEDDNAIVLISAHNNYVAVATTRFVSIFSGKQHPEWSFLYSTQTVDDDIQKLSIYVKILQAYKRLLAFATSFNLYIYDISTEDACNVISTVELSQPIDYMFFNSFHLLTLCKNGQISCWTAVTMSWLKQTCEPISCCDMSQSLLILATKTCKIKSADLVKFPLRMSDFDMLISDIYSASHDDEITAISLYTRVPYQTKDITYWLELAYGTRSGTVCVLGHHPETVGTQLRVFYTLRVHTMPICKVVLGEKYLFTVCDNEFHVRTYMLSRFRDMLNTQPGPSVLSSFNVMDYSSYFGQFIGEGRSKGPYISGDGQCFFVEQLQPHDLVVNIRSGVTGDLLCTLNSADSSEITAYNINFCDYQNMSACLPSLYFFTGHKSGTVQVWSLSMMIDEKNPLRIKEERYSIPNKKDTLKFLHSYKYEGSF